MKRIVFLVLIMSFIIGHFNDVQSQDVLNGIYVKERDKQRKPIPWVPLREADVMWSKMVMRKIDLRQKMNHPLYFPTEAIQERYSLIDLLLKGIKGELGEEPITPYSASNEIGPGEEFDVPITYEDIRVRFDATDQVQEVMDVETGEMIRNEIKGTLYSYEVKQYLVKEIWYFDKKYSTMQVRIVGLCPIREYVKDIGTGDGLDQEEEDFPEVTLRKLFWVEFDECRNLFAANEVFNPKNDAERRTFDDIFFKRYFSSVIVQEANVYDNRDINRYSLGQNTLEEAERIKAEIFDLEHDLWQY